VAPRVHKELASANLSHTRNTAEGASALGRVQLIEVQVKDAGNNEPGKEKDLVADMAADAIAYAEAIAGYLAAMFGAGAAGGPVMENKFKDIKPSIVIFDVSRGSSLLFSDADTSDVPVFRPCCRASAVGAV
jgi:hypothetical protein